MPRPGSNPFASFLPPPYSPSPPVSGASSLAPTDPPRQSSRTPSPDKRPGLLRSTLRKDDGEKRQSRQMPASMRSRPPAAAQAATLAWPNGTPNVLTPTQSNTSSSNTPYPAAAQRSSTPNALGQTLSNSSSSSHIQPKAARRKPVPDVEPNTRANGTSNGIAQPVSNVSISNPPPTKPPPPPPPHRRTSADPPPSRKVSRGENIRSVETPRKASVEVEGGKSDRAEGSDAADGDTAQWPARFSHLMKNLPRGVDAQAAKGVLQEIVMQGDEVHWDDVAGLDVAKKALKEAVVYPFLRPDLFMGLREPAQGILLFGPPGTGKTMLARAVATESKSTFFAISASSLTSKYLGESEKLVRALFSLAKALAPSIIFVDEIDSLLSARSGNSEHEATRRLKTEFLIQWSDLAKAAAGRKSNDPEGDASRVLVLAATNMPWAIDEAARRRFVRRQYIPLPEDPVRKEQLLRLMREQKHNLNGFEIHWLVQLTQGFSGSDITALAKDAAMGPLRSLGDKLLEMSPDDIRPIMFEDFEASLVNIRPSVSKQGLREFEDWAREFGERGG